MLQNRKAISIGDVTQNLALVQSNIAQAAQSAGRSPQDVQLVVVTKTHPVEVIERLIKAGIENIGESYVEEALPKINALSGRAEVHWHMIGHVQSRKAAQVCGNFDTVHSLDSLKLANHLNRAASEIGKRLPVLLECNVSAEESKFGWSSADEARWPELLAPLVQVLALPGLEVRGLMTVAPFTENPETVRIYFQKLRKLRDFLSSELPQAPWKELSMGMSADYEVAVQEGATIVRIGQAILGPRL